MLRITPEAAGPDTARYRLDGRLVRECVQDVEREIASAIERGPVALDVSGLTFVDDDGARLLRELLARQVELLGCSSYVAHLVGGGPSAA